MIDHAMCDDQPSLLESDYFYSTVFHILTSIEIPIHIFGAYAIIAKTPSKMASVKRSLFILHLLGAFLDIYFSFITTPVLNVPACSGYPLGISLWLGIPTSIQVYLAFSLTCAVSVSIVELFEDRYYVLCQGSSANRNWKRKLYSVFLYAVSFLFMIPGFLNIPDQDLGKQSVKEKILCIPSDVFDRPGYFVLATDTTPVLLCFSITGSFMTLQGLYFAGSIVWFLSSSTSKSRNLCKMQQQFMIALGVQVSIPLLIISVPCFLFTWMVATDYYNQAITNVTIIIVAAHGVVSTVTMLIVHRPYRKAIADIFYTEKSRNNSQPSVLWRSAPNLNKRVIF